MVFEFLKKFGLGTTNNYGLKKIVGSSDKSVGYTARRDVHKVIDEWMKVVEIDRISFGELLYKLGFDKNKTLYFEINPNDKNKILLSYGYEENVFGNETLELDLSKTYGSVFLRIEPDSYKIKISGDDYERKYLLRTGISLEDGIKLTKVEDYSKENIDDKTYTRRIYKDGFRIIINNYFFNEIRLICNKSDFLEINNEEELKEYLLNIDDNVTVSEVYRKICEISLGDENQYNEIDLSLSKNGKTVGSIGLQTKENFSLFAPKYKYEILEDGNKVSFNIGDSIVEIFNGISRRDIEFINKDYKINIKISPFNYETEINKVLPLRNYLMGLEFPVKIDEICKNICDRCLVDINNIPCLRVECFYKNESTDLLYLEHGKLICFQMNKDGKIIKIDKDGKFSYVSNSKKGELSVDMNQDVVTRCEVISDNGIESDNMGNSIYNGINEARDVKVRTRKMIDEMLK